MRPSLPVNYDIRVWSTRMMYRIHNKYKTSLRISGNQKPYIDEKTRQSKKDTRTTGL